jgi:exopolysaccharide biosynthesis protein
LCYFICKRPAFPLEIKISLGKLSTVIDCKTMKDRSIKPANIRKQKPRLFQIKFFFSAILFIFLFLASGNLLAQDFQNVQNGIEHAKFTRKIKDETVVFNALRLDLTKVRLDVVHAMDAAIGTEPVTSMAIRYGAIAAINAGFFRLDKSIFVGDATGILVIDGKLFSESFPGRTALTISNEKEKTIIGFTKKNVVPFLRIGKEDWQISGVNRERKTDELIMFTPEFHLTTLTDTKGIEILVERGKVVWIFDGKGSNLIPRNGFILSASGKYRKELIGKVKIGDTILTGTRIYPFGLSEGDVAEKSSQRIEDIIGGVPQLIKNGKIEITWEQEKSSKSFVETKHPRTAVAKLKDGKFLMITVDGRSEESAGIGLQDLAELLLEMGATDAMNLDGGGSTTMFLNGKVVNRPSDKEGERKVSDAILVFPRK